MIDQNALQRLLRDTTSHDQFAYSEGNNIMTWIGFKHIMYLAEEAVLAHFRQLGLGIRCLFEEHGLLLEIVANEGRILHALKLDEPVTTTVTPKASGRADLLTFVIAMFVERDGKTLKTYSGVVCVVFKRDRSLGMVPGETGKGMLESYVTECACDPRGGQGFASTGKPSLNWTFNIPYFYCHGNERLKMSGYLRLMEEADARFCTQQHIDVHALLQEKRWIPAVPSASVRILNEAYMNEELNLMYEVNDVIKSSLYKCRLTAQVWRRGERITVAEGEIVHAYAQILSRKDWSMVHFDLGVLTAIGA